MNKLITICALVCLYGCKSTTIDTDSFNMPESYYKEFYGRLSAQAYDFEAKNVDGKVIYYRINSNNNVYVTAHGDARLHYTGTIRIPEEVTYQGTVYKVKGLISSGDEFPDIGYLFKALPPFDGCSDLKKWFSQQRSITSVRIHSFCVPTSKPYACLPRFVIWAIVFSAIARV